MEYNEEDGSNRRGSMFKGILSPVIGLAGLNAVLFVSYGSILRCFEQPDKSPNLWDVYLAGTGAGFACFLISTPTDLVKIKAQMTKFPKTSLQITKEIHQTNGLKGFYQGGLITMIRDSPSYGIYFWVYEGLKRILQVNPSENEAWKLLLAGGMAGTVSWASIYPIDVVKSRLQMQKQAKGYNEAKILLTMDQPYASIRDCFVRSYRTEGLNVFFRGLWPTLLRAFPVNAVTFYMYEMTFVHSILFPLSPFIVARIRHINDKTWTEHSKSTAITSNIELTSRDTGILVALYAVGLLAGSPIFGWLGDKIKQRRLPMLLGTGASIVANILFMLSVTYPMLLVARFLQGISNACVWTMCLCLIADNWPREQLGSQMGKLVGFYPLGMMVGLPAGGLLYSELGYEAPFIASMILSGIDFLMRLVIIEGQHVEKVENAKPDVQEGTMKTVTWLQLLKQKRLIVSLGLTMVVATVMSAFEPTLSMRLAQEWGFNAAGCSLIVLAYMVPSIIASSVCGRLCDIFGTKIVAIVSLFFATPSCILIGIPNRELGSFWALIPGLILGGITIAGCQAPVFPEIAKVVDKENGGSSTSDGLARSYSLFNAAYGVGMCFGPLMGGYAFAGIGFFWLCTILSVFFFCFIPFAYFFIGDSRKLIYRRHLEEQKDEEKRQPPRTTNRQESSLSALTIINNESVFKK
ncbi:hypothetical protein G6F62_004623 [Rhizopus arrhizus]|nr:hypothetical protein G6F62_004623 [Rhizopus arrhizus]